MTLWQLLIPSPSFDAKPRLIRGKCSATEGHDTADRDEDEIQARKERAAAQRKARELEKIDGLARRTYLRRQRRRAILDYLATVDSANAVTVQEIADLLRKSDATITGDMQDMRRLKMVSWRKDGKRLHVYWNKL